MGLIGVMFLFLGLPLWSCTSVLVIALSVVFDAFLWQSSGILHGLSGLYGVLYRPYPEVRSRKCSAADEVMR